MSRVVYRGILRGKTVLLKERADLPEGTEVVVTPLRTEKGSPQVVLAAIDAPPHLKAEAVEELMCLVKEGKRLIRFENPLTRKQK